MKAAAAELNDNQEVKELDIDDDIEMHHADSQYDSHQLDTRHLDTLHSDTRHSDTCHSDTRHSDTCHLDTCHSDTHHLDTRHLDTLGYSPPGYLPLGYSPLGYSPLRYSPLRYSPLRYSPLGYSPLGYSPFGYSPIDFSKTLPESLARTVKSLFNDNTSENVSKKWNKYESWLFSLAGLLFKATQQQANINFICTSKKASAIEMAEIIVHCMRELRAGIVVYDVTLKEVLVTGELEKLTNWSTFVTKGMLLPEAVSVQMKVAGIRDYHFSNFLDNHFASPQMNPLLGTSDELPFIMGPLDTPVEILHCVLLGIVKYFLRATIKGLSGSKKQDLKAYLEGVQQDGLPERIDGHSLVQHVKSLIGKDFRLFAQVAPFALANVVTKELLAAWVSLSHLVAHLYMSHIDMAPYNEDFNNHMDQFVLHASKTPHFYEVVKPKLHLLRHIPD
ncbi:hypothetical protein HDU77_000329, partial [Chytriomyces hyalinus]